MSHNSQGFVSSSCHVIVCFSHVSLFSFQRPVIGLSVKIPANFVSLSLKSYHARLSLLFHMVCLVFDALPGISMTIIRRHKATLLTHTIRLHPYVTVYTNKDKGSRVITVTVVNRVITCHLYDW